MIPVEEISIANSQLVGTNGDTLGILVPKQTLTKDEALVHAAWLVVLADPLGNRFEAILDRVCNT